MFSTKDLYYRTVYQFYQFISYTISVLSKYHYPDSLIKQEFQKNLSIPQKDLRKSKNPSNENILPFITTLNPNNPNIYSTIKSSVDYLKNNTVSSFHNINLRKVSINSTISKIIPLKKNTEKFYQVRLTVVIKDVNTAIYLLINNHYTFRNVQIRFKLKHRSAYDSFNLICRHLWHLWYKEEYIGETGEGKTKQRDRVRVYHQHIWQPQYQQLKVEVHFRVCDNSKFWIFPLLQMHSKHTNLRRSYETRF